ncbi:MAG: AbrB/MazE/SpoVT family DNA-binding domain-containing protein [Chloroflexi bacterium]|nr:AbrB/MazE/SpoVT family DNA-binding domain-containing protein [Chloroflexota bacterium]
MRESTVQLRQQGTITLPISLRQRYNLRAGDVFSIIELGDGAFVLSPKSSTLARFGDKVGEILREEGLSMDDMLLGLEEEREKYYTEHYAENA